MLHCPAHFFFFFNDTATTEIYTLSLHDALPISHHRWIPGIGCADRENNCSRWRQSHRNLRDRSERGDAARRSEEHTSELQSRLHLVCRLLLEKKNTISAIPSSPPNNPSCSFVCP